MRRVRINRPSPAMIVACVALAITLSGTSYAVAQQVIPRNSVGTAQLKNNAVNTRKVANRSLRAIDFARGQIPRGPAGPAGAAGPAGPAGPAGAAATALWAVVDSTGTLIRNKGVASAQKLADGDYQVVFNQDVTACSYQATLGGPTTGLAIGEISAAHRVAVAAGIRVVTFNSTGVLADRPFYLAVFC
jgi:hypothetical protein